MLESILYDIINVSGSCKYAVIFQAIGRPYFPPYWGLGFQLCRYGYNHIDMMKAAVSRTIDNDIPLVSQLLLKWAEI